MYITCKLSLGIQMTTNPDNVSMVNTVTKHELGPPGSYCFTKKNYLAVRVFVEKLWFYLKNKFQEKPSNDD